MNININIERVVLENLDSQIASPQFERALKAELGDALAISFGSLSKLESHEVGAIDGGQMQLSDDLQVARLIARGIAKGIHP